MQLRYILYADVCVCVCVCVCVQFKSVIIAL